MDVPRTRTVWQVASGPAERAYADVLLRYGVALIGPGDAGPWRADLSDDAMGAVVRRFATEPEIGDAIVLRAGTSAIHAVGLIASDYLHLDAFDDVNGWDLQHARRVRWCALPQLHRFDAPVFGANPARFSRVQQQPVQDYACRFLASEPTRWQEAPLAALPAAEPPLAAVPSNVAELVAIAAELALRYSEDERFGDAPSESEVVAHLVVPFLRALGWPPERIAVEWRDIDVALFTTLPRTPGQCAVVVEVKRLHAGVEQALDQARGYVDDRGLSADIVVTDGVRYRMYAASKGYRAVAYANLLNLKQPALELFARLTAR